MSCKAFSTGEDLPIDKANSSYQELYNYLVNLKPIMNVGPGYKVFVFEDGDEINSYVKYLCQKDIDNRTITIVPFFKCMKLAYRQNNIAKQLYYVNIIDKVFANYPDDLDKVNSFINIYKAIYSHDFGNAALKNVMNKSPYFFYTALCETIYSLSSGAAGGISLLKADYKFYGDFKIIRAIYQTYPQISSDDMTRFNNTISHILSFYDDVNINDMMSIVFIKTFDILTPGLKKLADYIHQQKSTNTLPVVARNKPPGEGLAALTKRIQLELPTFIIGDVVDLNSLDKFLRDSRIYLTSKIFSYLLGQVNLEILLAWPIYHNDKIVVEIGYPNSTGDTTKIGILKSLDIRCHYRAIKCNHVDNTRFLIQLGILNFKKFNPKDTYLMTALSCIKKISMVDELIAQFKNPKSVCDLIRTSGNQYAVIQKYIADSI